MECSLSYLFPLKIVEKQLSRALLTQYNSSINSLSFLFAMEFPQFDKLKEIEDIQKDDIE